MDNAPVTAGSYRSAALRVMRAGWLPVVISVGNCLLPCVPFVRVRIGDCIFLRICLPFVGNGILFRLSLPFV